jgi:thiosulfate/3-mercaptopyruvate sulfurtransferase
VQWVAEDRPTDTEKPDVRIGDFTSQVNVDLLVNADWLEENLRNPNVVIVDSRPAEFYDGSEKEEHIERYGHISGAVSIPFPEIITENPPDRFKDISELRKIFLKAGVKPGSIVVTYCNTGIWACPVFFAAKYLGYDVRFYDGGFEEWSANKKYSVTEPVKVKQLN